MVHILKVIKFENLHTYVRTVKNPLLPTLIQSGITCKPIWSTFLDSFTFNILSINQNSAICNSTRNHETLGMKYTDFQSLDPTKSEFEETYTQKEFTTKLKKARRSTVKNVLQKYAT